MNAPIQDVIGILAKGPKDVNESRSLIQNYLDSKGNLYKFNLAPMMEPLGWSYNAEGRIVDLVGVPIEGAKAQMVYQDYNKEYRTFESPKTGKDGVFVLPRVFPGTFNLRVFANKDSSQNAVTINWVEPTNKRVKLGDFAIGKKIEVSAIATLGSISLKLSPVATSTGTIKVQHFADKMIVTRTLGTYIHTAEISWLTPPSGNINVSDKQLFMK